MESLEALLAELDQHAARLAVGDLSAKGALQRLFAPTGPLQEISISSGWGEEFLELARALDRAMGV